MGERWGFFWESVGVGLLVVNGFTFLGHGRFHIIGTALRLASFPEFPIARLVGIISLIICYFLVGGIILVIYRKMRKSESG